MTINNKPPADQLRYTQTVFAIFTNTLACEMKTGNQFRVLRNFLHIAVQIHVSVYFEYHRR